MTEKITSIKTKIKKVDPRRRRQRTTLSQRIKGNKDLDDARILYCNGKNGAILATGKITRDGVLCCCCQSLFTLTMFELHVGSTNRRPAANIFLQNGVSLKDCQDQLKRERNGFTRTVKSSGEHGIDKKYSEERGNDEKVSETTRVTAGKRALTFCDVFSRHGSYQDDSSDKCDSDTDIVLQTSKNDQESFESSKINDYTCSICCQNGDLLLCKQCTASFHVSCLGLATVPTCKLWYCPYCCCRICSRVSKVTKGKNTESRTDDNKRLVRCEQCLTLYHRSCVNGDSYIEDKSFCNTGCENIYRGLQGLLSKQMKVEGHDNLTWTVLQNSDGIDPKSLRKLKSALKVMHQTFKPSKEFQTKQDLTEILVLNKGAKLNLDHLRGFYTVILERDEEITTVVIIRVHGVKVAEIPLVATRSKDRKKGQCRLLMDLIEKVLFQFGVSRLVLPATDTTLPIWQNNFGFLQMTEFERYCLIGFNLLNFHGTIMCQKYLRYNVVFTED